MTRASNEARAAGPHEQRLLRETANRFEEAARTRTGLWFSNGECHSHARFLRRLLEGLEAPAAAANPKGALDADRS
jgi:hypothetical protein